MTPIDEALRLTQLGYVIFPLVEKVPKISRWPTMRPPGPATLAEWWRKWPDADVAIRTGGLIVIDVDDAGAGGPAERHLASLRPWCPVQRTQSGGRHYIFQRPAGKAWRSSNKKLASVVDHKTGPGSYFATGTGYTWLRPLDRPADKLPFPPAWLVETLDEMYRPKPAPVYRPVPTVSATDVERRAIAYLRSLPPSIQGSNGSGALYRAAAALTWGLSLSTDVALSLLLSDFNPRCQPPWQEKDLDRACRRAAERPHQRPRGYLLEAPRDANLSSIVNGVDLSGILQGGTQ